MQLELFDIPNIYAQRIITRCSVTTQNKKEIKAIPSLKELFKREGLKYEINHK
jgi:hypothetical protein